MMRGLRDYSRLSLRSLRRNIGALVASTVAPLGIFMSFGAFVIAFQPDPSTVAVAGATGGVDPQGIAEVESLIPDQYFTMVSVNDEPDISIFLDENRGILLVAEDDVTGFTTGAIEEAFQFENYALLSTTTPGVPQVDYWSRGMVAMVVTLALMGATGIAIDTAEMRHTGALEQLVTLPVTSMNFFTFMFAGHFFQAITIATATFVVGLIVGLLTWSGVGALLAPIPMILFFGLLGFIVALRVKSVEAALGIMLLILMTTLVLSSTFLPVGLIGAIDDFKALFPPTYLVDVIRHAWTPEQASFPLSHALIVSLTSLVVVAYMIHRSFTNLIGSTHERR